MHKRCTRGAQEVRTTRASQSRSAHPSFWRTHQHHPPLTGLGVWMRLLSLPQKKKTESASALHAQPSTTCRPSMRYTRVKIKKKDGLAREAVTEARAKCTRKRCERGAQEVHKRCVPYWPASVSLCTRQPLADQQHHPPLTGLGVG